MCTMSIHFWSPIEYISWLRYSNAVFYTTVDEPDTPVEENEDDIWPIFAGIAGALAMLVLLLVLFICVLLLKKQKTRNSISPGTYRWVYGAWPGNEANVCTRNSISSGTYRWVYGAWPGNEASAWPGNSISPGTYRWVYGACFFWPGNEASACTIQCLHVTHFCVMIVPVCTYECRH